jgi:hypothetical protein
VNFPIDGDHQPIILRNFSLGVGRVDAGDRDDARRLHSLFLLQSKQDCCCQNRRRSPRTPRPPPASKSGWSGDRQRSTLFCPLDSKRSKVLNRGLHPVELPTALSACLQVPAWATWATLSCMRRFRSGVFAPLGRVDAISVISSAVLRKDLQKRNFCVLWWSRIMLSAMRFNHVWTLHSPRKLARALYAFMKQSWTIDSARS